MNQLPKIRSCGEPEVPISHCSGCTDTKSEGTHQGCTVEHGHMGCFQGSFPPSDEECGQIIHASEGSVCANQKPCLRHPIPSNAQRTGDLGRVHKEDFSRTCSSSHLAGTRCPMCGKSTPLSPPSSGREWEIDFDGKFNIFGTDWYSNPAITKNILKHIKSFISKAVSDARARGFEEGKEKTILEHGLYLETLEEARVDERKKIVEEIKEDFVHKRDIISSLGMIRQWINEERITNKKMITNEELKSWFPELK